MWGGALKTFFWVWVIGTYHLVLPDEQCTFETIMNLQLYGFELVWDSAPSAFNGAEYAAREYGAPVPFPIKEGVI